MKVKELIAALLEAPDLNMIVSIQGYGKSSYIFHVEGVDPDDVNNTGICTIRPSTQIIAEDEVGYPPLRHKYYTEQEKNELSDSPSDHYFAS